MRNDNYLFGSWLKVYLSTYKKPFIKAETFETLKSYVKRYLPKDLKLTLLKNLSAVNLQNVIMAVPYSRTRVAVFDLIHGALSFAFTLGYIEKDISSFLIKPPHQRKRGSALNSYEVKEFLDKCKNHRCYFYFVFLLYTGCRREEALNLTYNDFDFINMVIHIRGTKTSSSDRFIPLFDHVNYFLPVVLPAGSFKLFNFRPDYVTKTFKKFCPRHKLHDLRHTFATRCIESGISASVVQSWLGHSRLETTTKIYTHILPSFQREESLKFLPYEV